MGIEKPICLTQAVEQTSPTLHDITTSSSRIKEAARTPGQHNNTSHHLRDKFGVPTHKLD
jgi:hypothetical protein